MRATFLALFVLAAILRLWRLWEMPFMHDEISALVRLYPSLHETVVRGVMELDVHPPGVQVFEWCWTRLFGYGPLAVKLPFVLMGLVGLVAIYRTGMAWTGVGAALSAVALLAVLQYGVLYGQLARPYAAGLFTTALCADQCTRWLASGRWRHLVGMGLGVVLSAYIHHFALLQAGIISLSVLPLIQRQHLRAYLLMLLCCALLYAPNLPILFKQLGLGGLSDWLPSPDRHWVPNHLWWVAHTSWWLAAPLLFLLAWSFVRVRVTPPRKAALLLLSCWGLLPLLIGLGYSAWRAPVIQHSGLLFSFPYLAFALFIGLADLGRRATIATVAFIALAGTVTLVITRQHYATVYSSAYRLMLDTARDALQGAYGPGPVAVFLDAPDPQLDFLLQHGPYDRHMPHARLRALAGDHGRLDSLLRTVDADIVVYGDAGAPPEQLARVQLFFPEVKALYDPPEGRVLVLGRNTGSLTTGTSSVATALPNGPLRGAWDIHADLPVHASSTGKAAWDYTGREYGILCELLLDSIAAMPQDQFEVFAEISTGEDVGNVAVVLELKQNDSTVFYRTAEYDQLRPFSHEGTHTLIVAARPEYAPAHGSPVLMRAYVHNRSAAAVHVHRMEVRLREGNPVIYGITGPITGPWRHRP